MYFVYMLRCEDGTIYTGSTDDLHRRFEAHAAGKGARYTRSHRPVRIEAGWRLESKGEALKLEYRIKQLTRESKEEIILGGLLPGMAEAVRIWPETMHDRRGDQTTERVD